jgi:hypothetical protein
MGITGRILKWQECHLIIRTDAVAASGSQALRFVKERLRGLAVRFSEAKSASQAQEIVKNVFINNFPECRTGRAACSTANKSADNRTRHGAYNGASRPHNHSG